MAQEVIWNGSSSFASGQTPYGFYDSDTEFSGSGTNSVDRFSEWAAQVFVILSATRTPRGRVRGSSI